MRAVQYSFLQSSVPEGTGMNDMNPVSLNQLTYLHSG
jgi:hypothetical protein